MLPTLYDQCIPLAPFSHATLSPVRTQKCPVARMLSSKSSTFFREPPSFLTTHSATSIIKTLLGDKPPGLPVNNFTCPFACPPFEASHNICTICLAGLSASVGAMGFTSLYLRMLITQQPALDA